MINQDRTCLERIEFNGRRLLLLLFCERDAFFCRILVSLVTGAVLVFPAGPALAQPNPSAGKEPPPGTAQAYSTEAGPATLPTGNPCQLDVSITSTYVGAGDVKFQAATDGRSHALSENADVRARIALNDQWSVLLGLGSENIFLNSVTGAPVPDQIHTVRLQPGLEYRVNAQWTAIASVGPAIYNLQDIHGNDVGLAGMVLTVYQFRPDLRLLLGASFNPDGDIPVLPVGGVHWDIKPNLALDLIMPKPRVIYQVASGLGVFAGGELNFVTFRTGDNIETKTGVAGFNNALGSYRDIRVGAGAEYNLNHRFSLSLEGGCSVGRQIDYSRIDSTLKFGSAPYVEGGLKIRF
jgi:hypothetical protein